MTRRRILFCDDDPDIREVIGLSLSLDPAVEARGCSSAEELLEIVVAWRPDVVVLDVMMPRMDGPTALAALRDIAGFQSVPVVFLTARTQSYESEHLATLGACGVIPKPFDPMTLAAELERLVRGPRRCGPAA